MADTTEPEKPAQPKLETHNALEVELVDYGDGYYSLELLTDDNRMLAVFLDVDHVRKLIADAARQFSGRGDPTVDRTS